MKKAILASAIIIVLAAISGICGWRYVHSSSYAIAHAPGWGQRALAVRAAILRSDFADAEKTITADLSNKEHSAEEFTLIVPGGNDAFLAQLDKWMKWDGHSLIPYMLRINYNFKTGMLFRGEKFSKDVPPDRMKIFESYLAGIWQDLEHIKDKGKQSRWYYRQMMSMLQYAGGENDKDTLFKEAIAKYPDYYQLYATRLDQLAPKWGGSVMQMTAFVNRYGSGTSGDFPLLAVRLYFSLVHDMDMNCTMEQERPRQACLTAMNDFLLSPSMQQRLTAVVDYYAHDNLYKLNTEMIAGICFCSERDMTYERPLIEILIRLGGKDNYALADISGNIQFHAKDYRAALEYYKQSLAQAKSFTFPYEGARNATLAKLYSNLTYVSRLLQNNADAVSYAKDAVALESTNKEYWSNLCSAYIVTNRLDEAIASCNASLNLEDNSRARWLRGNAYLNKQMPEQAAEDYLADLNYNDVFEDENKNQIFSVLNFTYKASRKWDKELKLFADHPELFKINPTDASRNYSDRCNAYMQLGDYTKALADCETSLALHPNHDVEVLRNNVRNALHHTQSAASPLFAAIDAHHNAQLKQLVAQGADINGANEYGFTPLMEALDKFDWPVAEFLLRQKADVKKPADNEGKDTLFHAVKDFCNEAITGCPPDTPQRMPELIESLLDAGANPERMSLRGESAYIAAVYLCETPVIKLMLEHGAEIDFKDNFSTATPLLAASGGCGTDMISLLLKYHPDLTYKNSWGVTPLDLARGRSDHVGPYKAQDVIKLLEDAQKQ